MDNNYLSTINALSRSKADNLINPASQAAQSPSALAASFQQLLLGMMMSSMSSDNTDDSSNSLFGSSSSNSGSMNSMMLVLMQQLLTKQMSALQTSTADQANGGSPAASLSTQAAPSINPQVLGQTINPSGDPAKSSPTGRPVGGVLTQGYHSTHHALDFGVPLGTPVKATMGGKVVYAGWNDQGYGNLVIVENGPYKTYFAHLSKIPVSLGQQVQAGSVVGISGSTGNSTGPHVHYEVRYNGQAIDPTSFTLNK